MNIEVKWTGEQPCLCSGEWILMIDGEDKSYLIPKDLRHDEMGTYGTYFSWHFENWNEVFEDYQDGMVCNEWIKHNKYWLDNISTDQTIQEQLFYEFQSSDWRYGSCGGCI